MKPGLGFLLLLMLVSSGSAFEASSKLAFQQLLNEAGLRMAAAPEFHEIPIRPNPLMAYEHALKHKSGLLELRFIVRPLSRISIEYNDPHNAAPEPNHLFPLLFESIANQLSLGSDSHSSSFSEQQALQRFNAQWAAASVFDLAPEFDSEFQTGLLIGMHKNQMADAYTLFLYNDHEQAKPLIKQALSIMSFASQP